MIQKTVFLQKQINSLTTSKKFDKNVNPKVFEMLDKFDTFAKVI